MYEAERWYHNGTTEEAGVYVGEGYVCVKCVDACCAAV